MSTIARWVSFANFADNSRSCRQVLMKYSEGWDVLLATDRSILVVTRIKILNPEFFGRNHRLRIRILRILKFPKIHEFLRILNCQF